MLMLSTICIFLLLSSQRFDFLAIFLDPLAADMDFLEVLTEGLEKVLMVRGGGREVITIYS